MKLLNKPFLDVRERSYWKGGINEIARIFKDVKSFLEIQIRKGNGRKDCQIRILRPVMRSNGWGEKLHFQLYNVAHLTEFSKVFLMVNITKITNRIRNEIDTTSVFSMNIIFKRREYKFGNMFKGGFEAKSWKVIRVLDIDKRI